MHVYYAVVIESKHYLCEKHRLRFRIIDCRQQWRRRWLLHCWRWQWEFQNIFIPCPVRVDIGVLKKHYNGKFFFFFFWHKENVDKRDDNDDDVTTMIVGVQRNVTFCRVVAVTVLSNRCWAMFAFSVLCVRRGNDWQGQRSLYGLNGSCLNEGASHETVCALASFFSLKD
jgi:hypothetical protein